MDGKENDVQIVAEKHKFKGVPVFTVIILILLALVSCAALNGGPYGGWFIYVAATGLVAYLDVLTDSRLVYIIPFAAVILSYVIFHPAFSVWAFAVVPSAFFTASAARGKINKNTALICSAVFILTSGVLFHFVLQAAIGGDFSIQGITNEILLPYREIKEIFVENRQSLAEAGIKLDSMHEILQDELLNLCPRWLFAAVWLSHGFRCGWLHAFQSFFSYEGVPISCGIQMSLISAYVFTAAYLITLIFRFFMGIRR